MQAEVIEEGGEHANVLASPVESQVASPPVGSQEPCPMENTFL